MQPTADRAPLGLRRGLGYRLFLAIVALPSLLFAVAGLFGFDRLIGPARGGVGLLVKLFAGEFFAALLLVSTLSLVWALAAPRWVEKLVVRYSPVLEWGILLFIPGFLAFMYCMLGA